jgi:hypothetical protein
MESYIGKEEELMPPKPKVSAKVSAAAFKSLVLALLLGSGSLIAQEGTKPRVFISDSQSWQTSGGFGGSRDGFGGANSGGARPQTAEIIKTFNEKCPSCIVTANKDKADYAVILEHEGGKDPFSRDNKFALFNKNGDVIKSGSTRSLGNAVKEACRVILNDWREPTSRKETSATKPEKSGS